MEITYDINWSNAINRLCLLPKLLSKLQIMFYTQAFDGVMKFKIIKFDFLKKKKNFGSKITNIFPSLASAFY